VTLFRIRKECTPAAPSSSPGYEVKARDINLDSVARDLKRHSQCGGHCGLAMTDNLPAFAHGGIVKGPTVGLMGEAGSPEAAIPLNDRGASFMQKNDGVR